jgi:hypothetical protein
MKKLIFASFLISVFLISCKKDEILKADDNYVDKSKLFLKDVKSDSAAEYFISGEFDGYKIYFASTFSDLYPYHDTVMNAIYVDSSIGLDNIHLIRYNRERSAMIAIYYDQAKIETRQFPYILPRANLAQCEAVQMEIINMHKLGTTGQGSPTDDFSFFGHTNTNIKFVTTSFINNILEGTFEGALTSMTKSTIKVTNGKFRIRVRWVRYH